MLLNGWVDGGLTLGELLQGALDLLGAGVLGEVAAGAGS